MLHNISPPLVSHPLVFFFIIVDTTWPEEAYGGVSTDKKLRAAMDRAALPTAPRAARGPDMDTSKIPDGPPYTAFLGNLSYDVDKEDILEFFATKKVLFNFSFIVTGHFNTKLFHCKLFRYNNQFYSVKVYM